MSGICIWITGLSASGKTTLCGELASMLEQNNLKPIVLDGDKLRAVLGNQGYSREERVEIGLKYSRLASLLQSQGHIVILAVIGMYKEVFVSNRQGIENYFEVFLNVPMTELKSRDPKGIYSRYEAGSIKNVAGLDLLTDFPTESDFVFDWASAPETKASDLAKNIVEAIQKKKLINIFVSDK